MTSTDMPPTWREMLNRARTPTEVLAIAQDFLERLSMLEIAVLPPSCQPRTLSSLDDLNGYAYDVARAAAYPESESEKALAKVNGFIRETTQRLAVLTSPRIKDGRVDWRGTRAKNID